jgi:hypothetical protein
MARRCGYNNYKIAWLNGAHNKLLQVAGCLHFLLKKLPVFCTASKLSRCLESRGSFDRNRCWLARMWQVKKQSTYACECLQLLQVTLWRTSCRCDASHEPGIRLGLLVRLRCTCQNPLLLFPSVYERVLA